MSIIQTVLGPIDPNLLGRTLTHEHIAIDFRHFHCGPPCDELKSYFGNNITLENVGYLKQYPYSSLTNTILYDDETLEAVKKDLYSYKKFGGDSIIENTNHGIKRDLEFMVDVSKATKVNIVAGTGHYVHSVQERDTLNLTIEQLADLYSKEMITGVEVPGRGMVKCGFIGEVGSVWPIHDFEARCIKATGEIQEVLGCGVSFHPGRDSKAPFEIVRQYLEAGGKADKCVMSHLDRTIFDIDELLEFAKLGTYVQYDLFGIECSYYQLNSTIDMPSDAQRINNFVKLVEEGFEDKLLIAHDIHTKHRLVWLLKK
ncbi:PTER family protein [Megaselia abdita]